MFLKVFPVKAVRRFNMKGKLSPRYIDPYEIIEKLNPMVYRFDLQAELEHAHNAFHISQLIKYVPDPNYVIIADPVEVDYRVKQLRNKNIPLEKILWASHDTSEAIWETKEAISSKYTYLFEVRSRFLLNCKF